MVGEGEMNNELLSFDFFLKNCVRMGQDDGTALPFNPYPTQNEMFRAFQSKRFSLIYKNQPNGTSTAIAIYVFWKMMFRHGTVVLYLGPDDAEVNRFRKTFRNITDDANFWDLPIYPYKLPTMTIVHNSRDHVDFNNHSRIVFAHARADGNTCFACSCSFNLLIFEECQQMAHLDEYWSALMPNIATGGAAIMTKTADVMDRMRRERGDDVGIVE